ncbi:PQQ-like beta-propeller repeat protein [Jannaschia sp. LMIT008]|uniref:PQQ-like beta-propeller repeat protein n=1 Tax=Jannaschia maritima TaxID=3032585 RepID=UPI002810ACFB|nr:PQQ-binding-like beta-propeller repeat protein [Jannaschia sp. LMIT008]
MIPTRPPIAKSGLPMLLAAILLAACSNQDPVLPGERQDVRADGGPGVLAVVATDVRGPTPIALPAARRLADWPLRVGNVRNDPGHATLRPTPQRVWSTSIGQGDTRRQRITADPVSDGARIFTMDARSRVTATTLDGAIVWSVSLVPNWDRDIDAAGGGLAVAGGTLYATTGYGQLHALDASSGGSRWVQRLDAPLTAPKPSGGLVYLVSRDGRGWAVAADTGRIRWEVPAAEASIVIATAPAPALTDRLAVFPFGSGEVVATQRDSGVRVWGTSILDSRRGVAYADVGDITGDPVVSGGRIYVGTTSGRIVALDAESGDRLWTARDGAVSPLVAAGGSVFAVTDRAQLIRLDAATGETVWRADLPFYRNTRRLARRQGVFVHHGPVLAGGRLWVASSDGALRGFDPTSGALAASASLPDGAATRPIAFRDALFVVGSDGTLHAYR